MPVGCSFYHDGYAVKLEAGTLDASGLRCPRSCKSPLHITRSTVLRAVFFLDADEHGILVCVRVPFRLALARCPVCKGRFRVLPADILPRKRYSVDVIGFLAAVYTKGELSLRCVAWAQMDGASLAHSTLHAWTEGAGAYVLGRSAGEVPDALPASRVLAEAESRHPEVRQIRQTKPEVSPLRYRSAARRDRLAACHLLLLCALAIGAARGSFLSDLNRLVFTWCGGGGIGWRTGLTSTPIEQGTKGLVADSPPTKTARTEARRCRTRGRSPPSDCSR